MEPKTAPQSERETAPLPPGCAEGYLRANGVRLHYVTLAPVRSSCCCTATRNSGTAIATSFPRWRKPIASSRSICAATTFRTSLPAGYDIATLCEDLRGAIEALGERQADVVGHDWGGVLAWALAMRAPEHVRRLVILNAPHPATFQRTLYSPSQWLRSAYVGFFQLEGIAEEALSHDNYTLIRRTFRAADRERAWLTDADIQRYVDAIARPGALTAALSYYRQVVRRGPGIVGPARVITAPTLVLWGELDPYLGVESLDGLERWVDELRVQRFSTAGHWLNQQEPARVNEALLEFLR